MRMVSPSRERIARLANALLDALTRAGAITLSKNEDVVRQAVALALADELAREVEREDAVRRRLATTRGVPPPETREWEELFRKWMEEEYLRDGLES
ncbi:MAG TPA: DUF507 family protein [Thermoanaerobaculia bacterium]|nr:DUF507 family protein [Thermoanaerobaculia bacterium]